MSYSFSSLDSVMPDTKLTLKDDFAILYHPKKFLDPSFHLTSIQKDEIHWFNDI
jgi:hypothetical protein